MPDSSMSANPFIMKRIKIGTSNKTSNQTNKTLIPDEVFEALFAYLDVHGSFDRVADSGSEASSKSKSFLKVLCLLLFSTVFFGTTQAQTSGCSLACQGPINAPLQLAPDPATCMATLSIPTSGLTSGNCDDDFGILVVNAADLNTLVYSAQNLSAGDSFTFGPVALGDVFRVTYIETNTNSCNSFYEIIDEVPPTFTSCRDTLLNCTFGLDLEDTSVFAPDVIDNCFGTTQLEVRILNELNCQNTSPFPDTLTKISIREWIVFDPALPNERDTCVQQVRFRTPDLSQIEFPSDALIDCSENPNDYTLSGRPTIYGEEIPSSGTNACQLIAVPNDITVLESCSENTFSIEREWRISYWCDNTVMLLDTQSVTVADTTAPVITCPNNFSVGTQTQPGECGASFLLPSASATDNCSEIIYSAYFSSLGITGFGPFHNISPGFHNVIYTATDECGNSSTCNINVTVYDNESPTPVCEEFTDIALSSDGTATVSACIFDANNNCANPASYDDCNPVSFTASLDNANFTEELTFDCSQAGTTFPVFLKVSEEGVFDPLSTVCMVNVEIEDTEQPTVICPINPTPQDCQTDFSNLWADFGAPIINDNCDFVLDSVITTNISQCGEGQITRTYTAVDASGNSNSCTQTIAVINSSPFDGTGINFPQDYDEFNTCRDPLTLTPADLNPNYLQDIFPVGGTPCGMLAVSFDDTFFDLNAPSCYKIIRTWTVIDWCQYDEENPSAGGIWTSNQIIKVLDDQAPVLVAPASVVAEVDSNCENGVITDLVVSATDGCNPNEITITNNYTSDTDGTANGTYPFGNTVVTFTASDNCGNTSTAEVVVQVIDQKKPTIICNDNLATDLANMGTNGMVMSNVDYFIFDAFDNCTPSSDLIFGMEIFNGTEDGIPAVNTDLAFTCDHEGEVALEIWVTDASNNSEVCVVTLDVQDNNNVCAGESNEITVAGAIVTEPGDEVENAEVMLYSNSNAFPDMTGYEGSFAFPDLPIGADYVVEPHKDGDDANGVTTWDIILIIRHIQNLELLDSPYKIIAADVNGTESVTMSDVVGIKRIILGIDEEFPFMESWRFVDMYYDFPNPQNPWQEEFPEVVELDNLYNSELAANFVAIKAGDVNTSAQANYTGNSAEERTADKVLMIKSFNQKFAAGDEVNFDLSATVQNIAGFQFSINYDTDKLQLVEAQGADLTKDNMQFNLKNAGSLVCAWQEATGLQVLGDKEIMQLKFIAKEEGTLAGSIRLTDQPLRKEAYILKNKANQAEMADIKLLFEENTDFVLYQNRPNPFRTETKIQFDLAQDEEITLDFFDARGRQLHAIKGSFAAGRNEITVTNKDLGITGIIWYQLNTASGTQTRKMLVQ